ncbi:MAG: hypothetical protein PUC40_00005, partial [Lachnospiraceae bacterium]|nr:hypothetical protein [Lachnospiraceae bacterium]
KIFSIYNTADTYFVSRLGLTGIEIAQPVSDIISAIISLPVVLHHMHEFGPDRKNVSVRTRTSDTCDS